MKRALISIAACLGMAVLVCLTLAMFAAPVVLLFFP